MLTPYSGNYLIKTSGLDQVPPSLPTAAKLPDHLSRSGGHDFRMFIVGMESLFDSPKKETFFQKIINFVKEFFQEMGVLEGPELEFSNFEFPKLKAVLYRGNEIEHKTVTVDEVFDYFIRLSPRRLDFERPAFNRADAGTRAPPHWNIASESVQSKPVSQEDKMRFAKDVFAEEIGVSKDISFAQCITEYRRLAKSYHPDKFPEGPERVEMEEKFKKLKESWNTFHTALGEGCDNTKALEEIDKRFQKEEGVQPEAAKMQQQKDIPIEPGKGEQEAPFDLD